MRGADKPRVSRGCRLDEARFESNHIGRFDINRTRSPIKTLLIPSLRSLVLKSLPSFPEPAQLGGNQKSATIYDDHASHGTGMPAAPHRARLRGTSGEKSSNDDSGRFPADARLLSRALASDGALPA
jgi:hypothetical protein